MVRLSDLQELHDRKWRETRTTLNKGEMLRKERSRLQRYDAMLNDSTDQVESMTARVFDRWAQARYKEDYESGRERALYDYIAVRGATAFRAEWVLDPIQEKRRTLLDDPTATTEQKKHARWFLLEIGKALARGGQGRKSDPSRNKALASEYREMLPKVKRMAKSARRYAEIQSELTKDKQSVAVEELAEIYNLPKEDVDLLVTFLASETPSYATARLVAIHHFSNIRTVQRAAKISFRS